LQNKNNQYSYTGLEGTHIIIKEEQNILYDDICYDSIFIMDYFPVVNAAYTIEISCNNLKTVKAYTRIPPAIKCKSHFTSGAYYWQDSEYKMKLDSFEIPQMENVCLWITSYQIFQNNEEVQYNELYTKNPLVDKTNSVAGMGVKNEAVGSIYHNGFLRVKNKNLSFLDELVFTPNYVYVLDNMPDESFSPQTKIKIKIITASPEYDQFSKSLYEQKSMIVSNGDISSVFFQPKTVYSNIENGMGIFAGMNEVDVLFDIPAENE
jgi:hypothetical protein